MSDIEKPAGPEAPPLKDLTKKHFQDQIEQAKGLIQKYRAQIKELQDGIQQEVGVIGYADHILKTFKLPDAPEPKKKTDLEVK